MRKPLKHRAHTVLNSLTTIQACKMVRWLPLESNPDVMNKFIQSLGVKSSWQFVDVLSLDPELLCMVPQPVCALLLLFPTSEKYANFKKEVQDRVEKDGQEVSPNLYFMRQTVGNACGTVAIIHSIANNTDQLELEDGFLKNFIAETQTLTPAERGSKLETDEGISEAHELYAQEGQTEAPPVEERVNLHFIALVQKDGCLYELDGAKLFPVNHGKTTSEEFLKNAVKVCQEYMNRDPDEMHFTVVALSAAT